MTTTSELLRLTLQGTGENENTWGEVLNAQLKLLETAIAGQVRIVLAANDYTLATHAGAADEARAFALQIEGAPTQVLNVIVPATTKAYLVNNATSRGHAVTIRTKNGSGVSVPAGAARWVYCDAANVRFAATAEDARKVGGMLPGNAVTRDVNANAGNTLLDRDHLDERYVQGGALGGNFTTGDVKITFKNAESGWVRMADDSIGPSNSGATARANNDTQALYTLLWNNVSAQWAPVSGGRGATAGDDWNAGKVLSLPRTLGRALAVAGAGFALSNRDLGATVGAEIHTLSTAEMPSHRHKNGMADDSGLGNNAFVYGQTAEDIPGQAANGVGTSSNPRYQGYTSNEGDSDAHNNMQPSTFVNVLIKL